MIKKIYLSVLFDDVNDLFIKHISQYKRIYFNFIIKSLNRAQFFDSGGFGDDYFI